MQNLINANQKSSTQTAMDDLGEVTPYYKTTPSLPPLGIQFHNQSPTINITGVAAGKSVLIDLPSGGGFMYNMSVSLLGTCTLVSADLGTYPGLNSWRYLQFESGGKILVYKTKNSLYAQLKKMKDLDFKNYCFRYAQFLNPSTELLAAVGTDVQFLTYIPFIDNFLSSPEKALLLDNFKDLKLRIMFDTPAQAGLTNPITAINCSLIAQTYMPKLSVFSEMKLKDWTKPFAMAMINCDEESIPLQGALSTKIPINSSFLDSKTHIFIRQNNNTVDSPAAVGLPTVPIETVVFNLNGQPFLDGTIKPSRINECAARRGNSTLTPGPSNIIYDQKCDDIITIDWGILCSRLSNTGTAFWSELRGSTITVTYASLAAGDVYENFSLYLVHEYNQVAEYQPGQGGGVLAVTSVS